MRRPVRDRDTPGCLTADGCVVAAPSTQVAWGRSCECSIWPAGRARPRVPDELLRRLERFGSCVESADREGVQRTRCQAADVEELRPRATDRMPQYLRGLVDIVDDAEQVVPLELVVRRLLAMLTSRRPQTPVVVAPEGRCRPPPDRGANGLLPRTRRSSRGSAQGGRPRSSTDSTTS